MSITLTNNVLVEAAPADQDQFNRTGVMRDDQYAFCDEGDKTKQLAFQVSSVPTNTKVVLTAPTSSGTIQTSGGLVQSEAANGKMGLTTLSGGTKVVSNTSVTANSRIFLTAQTTAGTAGFLLVSARTPGASFTILSSSGTDTSTVAYLICEPA